MPGLRAGAAYIDIHGRLTRDFGRNVEREGSSRLSGVGEKLGGILAGGMATAAAAAGVVLVKGLSDAIANEQSGDMLTARLGLEGPQAEAFGRAAGELYAGAWGDSLDQVNDALANVHRNIGEGVGPAEDALTRISGLALDFSKTFESDMAMTTSAVGQMIRTGLVGDAEEAFDVLTRGAQQGADKAGDLVETFNEYGTQFRQLGLDGAAAVGLLTQGVQAGARDADIVADSLKEFAIRAQDGSATTAAGFELIGLNAEKMAAAVAKGGPDAANALDQTLDKLREIKDPAAQAQAAVALFGTQSEDLQDALYALDPSSAVQGLGDVEGAAQKMSDTLNDNLGTRLESLKRRGLQALAGFIGDKVLPAIDRLAPVVERAVDKVVEKWPEIQAAVQPVVEAIVALIEEKWPQIQAVIEDVMTTVSEVVSGVLELIRVVWDNWGTYIVEFVTSTFSAIMKQIEGALQVIRGIVDLVLGILTGDWSRAWDGVKNIVAGVWKIITGAIEQALARVRFIVKVALDILKGVFSGAWDAIYSKVRGAFDSIVSFFGGLGGRLSRAAGDVFGWLWRAFKSAVNLIIRGWNRIEFKIPGFDPPGPGPKFGGFTLGVPDIPELRAKGGPMLPGRSYVVGPGHGVELLRMGATGGHMFPQDELVAGLAGAVGRGGVVFEKGAIVVDGGDFTADEVVDALGAKLGWKLTTRNDR